MTTHVDDDGEPDDGLSDTVSAALTWERDGLYAALAYEKDQAARRSVAGIVRADLLRAVTSYRWGALELGALYQQARDAASGSDLEDRGYLLSAAWNLDERITLKVQGGENRGEESDETLSLWALGADYRLARNATAFVYLSQLERDQAGSEDHAAGTGLIYKPLDAPGFEEHPHRAPTEWPSTGRYNVISDLNHGAPGPHLVFNGHLDVVPAEPVDMWTRPPWEPWQKDGWLYGRGAGDMKAGIAAMVMAVEAVRQAGVEINFPLTLQTVIEEECTGNGALACLHQGFSGDFVLIPEPFGAQIYAGQVGVLWFRMRLDGGRIYQYISFRYVGRQRRCYCLACSTKPGVGWSNSYRALQS
nr:M20/M25/M40 family metallo-hydrolase [Exiguobacterium sp. N4-1P]